MSSADRADQPRSAIPVLANSTPEENVTDQSSELGRNGSAAEAQPSPLKRHPFDYTVEVCAVCGMGLSMGIGPSTGRCPRHAQAGGVVIRVRALPAFQQTSHRYAPSERDLRKLVRAGAIPMRSNEPNPAAGPWPDYFAPEATDA